MEDSDRVANYLPEIKQMVVALESHSYQDLDVLFEALEQNLAMVYGIYAEELSFLTKDEPQTEVAEQIGTQFTNLGLLLETIGEELGVQNYEQALSNLYDLSDEADTLYSLFDSYQRVIEEQPKFSEVPYTHELLRVAKHFLNGELTLDAVEARLEVFIGYHDALREQIATLVPSDSERRVLEERQEDLEEALAIQAQAIHDLEEALSHSDRAMIEDALEALLEASDLFVEVYRQLQQAEFTPKSIPCLRCAEPNTLDSKICRACGAVLPQSAAALEPASTLVLDEEGQMVGQKESEEIAKLQRAVDGFLREGNPEPLRASLQIFAQKLTMGRRQFQKMETPPPDLPAEQAALLRDAKQLFSEALENLTHGHQLLLEGVEEIDHLKLEEGMQILRLGESLLLDFQNAFSQAERMSPRG